MHQMWNKCAFLAGDALSVVGVSEAMPESVSSDGREEFVRVRQASDMKVKVSYLAEFC